MMKTTRERSEVGAIVGRFQVPELHEEHKALIQRVVDTHPRVLVILGLAADACKCTYNNPLDFATRKLMVEHAFPNVEVFYIKDVGNNEVWSKDLDRIIAGQIGPGQKVVLYGGRDSFLPHYKGKFPTEELVPNKIISGKEIRKNVGIKSKGTAAFREGVIWAVENQWPGALPTVDAAIIDPNTAKILLGKKPNREQFQFIGGFATPDSPNFESDAEREVREETGLDCVNFRYLASAKIDDWRFKSERNKIKTTFFTCELYGGIAKADDDISEVKWFDLEALTENLFIVEHRPLFRILKEKVIDPQLKVGTCADMPFIKNSVAVALLRGNGVYLSKRTNTRLFDGLWQLTGGKCDGDEPHIAAAVRETKEETGLDIAPERLTLFDKIVGDPSTKVCFIYIVDLGANEVPENPEKDKNTEWELVSFQDAKKLDLMPGLLAVIEKLEKR